MSSIKLRNSFYGDRDSTKISKLKEVGREKSFLMLDVSRVVTIDKKCS